MPTVLLVDDESGLRHALATLLQKRGFHTLEADSAHAALACLADPKAKIEVIVTDVMMPDDNGLTLAHRVRERNPNVKVLFMSAFPLHILERKFGVPKDLQSVFLQKPFEAGTLAAKIQEVLGICKVDVAGTS